MAEMNELLEKLKIRELLDKYCDGVNQRDSELWGSTWSQNAVWEIPHLDMTRPVENFELTQGMCMHWITVGTTQEEYIPRRI